MNHQPFEEWLLEDASLTVQQERELQMHLRVCTACSGIAASNLALHSRRLASPAAGFTERFRPRLAAWRKEQLRRQAIGTIVLVLAGIALLYGVAGPAMIAAVRSPAAWLRDVTAYLVAGLTVARVAEDVGSTLLRGLMNLVPQPAWWAMFGAAGAAGILWTLTMRRLAKVTRGA